MTRMGAQLVAIVFAAHASRPHREVLVLARMALSALDQPSRKHPDQPVETYFGGWEPLAMVLGFDVPDRNDEDPKVTLARSTGRTAAKRALKGLVGDGVVARLGRDGEELLAGQSYGFVGHTQVYRLHLLGGRERGTQASPKGGHSPVPLSRRKGDTHVRKGGHSSVPPRNQ